eukprot:comp115981_c0_seq1/m.48955 comp115981_c0_seq1/g.48955  ORF comp115981_c0_seq1/g.48955 comp115981_c0_seq1/m.48955 type:complete len:211 (-) comp115981_c0_seq1:72-704(-)
MPEALLPEPIMQALHRVRAVMFDMDGTLTLPCIDFAKMRRMAGVPEGMPILETVMTWPEPRRGAAMEAIRLVEKEAREGQELMDGTHDLLSYLRSKNIPRGILTRNDNDAVLHFVETLKMDDAFTSIYTREFLPAKPDPAPLLHWAEEIQVPPAEILMVGDHDDDITCGLRAGSVTCLMEQHTNTHHRHVAHFNVSSPSQLLQLLQSVWK